MSARGTTDFKATKNSRFADNASGQIGADDSRNMFEDVADSFKNIVTDAYKFYTVTASGTDTYTATLSPAITAYGSTDVYLILFTNANTGAATLNLNGLGAKAIRKNGATALDAGDISSGQILALAYDGTNMQILGKFSSGAGTSGTYTPTLTNGANVASSTAALCQYMRVGSVVTVSGTFTVDPTAGAPTFTTLDISLPVASNFANVRECGGTAVGLSGSTTQVAMMYADPTNDRVTVEFFSSTTNPIGFYFSFTYLVI